MIKLFKRNSKVMTVTTGDPLLRCCAVQNRDGSVSLGIVNRHPEDTEITLDSSLFKKDIRVYEYEPANVPYNVFGDLQGVSAVLPKDSATYTLKGTSVTFFTTDYQEKAETVEASGVKAEEGKLTWEAVADPNHCYYRIFQDGKQIASTIACDLPIEDENAAYKVLSVDQWGNV